MSLKTWASREVPQASNIGELLAQWATCLYSIYSIKGWVFVVGLH